MKESNILLYETEDGKINVDVILKYEILLFDEIEYIRESDNKKWHYFNIIARKK